MRMARGFTLVELLVVMAAIGLLLSLAAPRYLQHLDRGREVALKHNLAAIRSSIEAFHADRGRVPEDLKELVTERYLRAIPLDPLTDRDDTWIVTPPAGQRNGMADVRSGASGQSRDGSPYGSW
jgi:general secretion pathway protein G